MATVIFLDQGTKALITGNMELYQGIRIAPFLNFVYAFNEGAAFVFVSRESSPALKPRNVRYRRALLCMELKYELLRLVDTHEGSGSLPFSERLQF